MMNKKFQLLLFTCIGYLPALAQNIKIPALEVYAKVDQAVGNIAFTDLGDLVYSHHPFFTPQYRVVSYNTKTNTTAPFPNLLWNTPRVSDDHFLSNVLGIRSDEHGVIWLLDMGQRNPVTPKLVGWNTQRNVLERIYYLPASAINASSQPNDMVMDLKHQVCIIADEGIGNGGDGSTAALIVIDLKTGSTRRLLQGSRFTIPENTPTIINGIPLAIKGKNLLVGADGITADAAYEWIYFGPLNGTKLFRVSISNLINKNLSSVELEKMVETYSDKPNNGGLSIDQDGNIYLTALETNSVAVILAKDRSLHQLVTDKKMLWPDGVSYNKKDGYMYVSAAQVHLGKPFNGGIDKSTDPFYIFRFKPLAKGVPNR